MAHDIDRSGTLEQAFPGLRSRDGLKETCSLLRLEKFRGDFRPEDLWQKLPEVDHPGVPNHRLRKYLIDVVELDCPGNLLTTLGATNLWNGLVTSGLTTPWNAANGYLGVGDGAPATGAGTASFTNGSTAVTGSGTSFTSLFNVGDFILCNTDSTQSLYSIGTVGSNTSITLNSNFLGTSQSGVAYSRVPQPAVGNTDLFASTNKLRVNISGAPTVSTNTCTAVASFGSAQALFAWQEWGFFNASSAGTMFNHKVISLGVKAANSTWQLTVTLTAN